MLLDNLFCLIVLIVGTFLVTISFFDCPPPNIVYKYIPKHTLDVQFSEADNQPSRIYENMFNGS